MKRCIWIFALLLGLTLDVRPASLETIEGARLIDDPDNDGDSFLIAAGNQQWRIRLYFVDCPERSAEAQTDAERVQEQMRHFGLTNASQITRFGEEARRFVERTLAKPFTVHTAKASAPGRFGGRIYAFVTAANGEDLGTLLVRGGLARPHGTVRETPAGIPGEEWANRLKDLEGAAMLRRAGIWAESSPERIAELRQQARDKMEELRQVSKQSRTAKAADQLPIDLNTATLSELESLPGIGRKLGQRILEGRPYREVDDVLKVKGVGKKTLDAIRPRITVRPRSRRTFRRAGG